MLYHVVVYHDIFNYDNRLYYDVVYYSIMLYYASGPQVQRGAWNVPWVFAQMTYKKERKKGYSIV